jgi:predicted dehydrogenase
MSNKNRVAVVGTGHRGTGMWGRELLSGWNDCVEMVALCDSNPQRGAAARALMKSNAPLYTDFGQMLADVKPQKVIVATPDYTHDDIIVRALEAGSDVLTEKPLTTTLAKARRILEAERRTGRRVDVTFNYRFAPVAATIKRLIRDRAIGEVTSVDFHWYLDTQHGADYFRRWHRRIENSGSLFVHKATHHFDLVNWYLDTTPAVVHALGALKVYGSNGSFRGVNCRSCPHTGTCRFYLDIRKDDWLAGLYDEPTEADGYLRDGCVFAEEIDIYDTMSALILLKNGVQVSHSLNAAMPIEGYRLAFNGRDGRIEVRVFERQPWDEPPIDKVELVRNFGAREIIAVPRGAGGHFGGDTLMRDALFKGDSADPLGQRAGAEAGLMSMITGVAAVESVQTGRPVVIDELLARAT